MKEKWIRRASLLLAVCSVLLCFAGCVDLDSLDDNTLDTTDDGNPYNYTTEYNGQNFNILNVETNTYDMICYVTVSAENTSDHLNSAIYKRQQYVQQKTGVTIKEENVGDSATRANQLIATGDTTYSVVYQSVTALPNGVQMGNYLELNALDGLHFDESYWNSDFLSTTSLNHKNYGALSDLQLMSIEGTWCLFFNQAMLDDINMDYPYQLAREGRWTLDRMFEYCDAVASLNGEASWGQLQADGSSIYGLISMKNAALCQHMFYATDAVFVTKDRTDDLPYWTGESEHMTDVISKIASGCKVKGNYSNASPYPSNDTYYVQMFKRSRSLFLGAEIKEGHATLSDMTDTFGVMPLPKYDENQKNYRSTFFSSCAVLTIPYNCADVAFTTFMADVLSYETDRTVISSYYDVTLTQKSIRNEESEEMMDLILENRGCDIAVTYGWLDKLCEDICLKIMAGVSEQSSKISQYAASIQQSMADLVNAIG